MDGRVGKQPYLAEVTSKQNIQGVVQNLITACSKEMNKNLDTWKPHLIYIAKPISTCSKGNIKYVV